MNLRKECSGKRQLVNIKDLVSWKRTFQKVNCCFAILRSTGKRPVTVGACWLHSSGQQSALFPRHQQGRLAVSDGLSYTIEGAAAPQGGGLERSRSNRRHPHPGALLSTSRWSCREDEFQFLNFPGSRQARFQSILTALTFTITVNSTSRSCCKDQFTCPGFPVDTWEQRTNGPMSRNEIWNLPFLLPLMSRHAGLRGEAMKLLRGWYLVAQEDVGSTVSLSTAPVSTATERDDLYW